MSCSRYADKTKKTKSFMLSSLSPKNPKYLKHSSSYYFCITCFVHVLSEYISCIQWMPNSHFFEQKFFCWFRYKKCSNFNNSARESAFCHLLWLQRSGLASGTVDGSGTIGNNMSWYLSLSQTSVNISTLYYIFHLVPEPDPVPFPASVNIFIKEIF